MTSVDLMADKKHHAFPTPAEHLLLDEKGAKVVRTKRISADPIALVGADLVRGGLVVGHSIGGAAVLRQDGLDQSPYRAWGVAEGLILLGDYMLVPQHSKIAGSTYESL